MTKHRRYSRKRGQRRNRRASRKMRGGENLTREQFNDELHTFLQSKNRDTDDAEVINRFFNYYERTHNLERVIGALELIFNLVPNSTLEEILNDWDNLDDTTFLSEGHSIDDDENILNQTFGSQSSDSEQSIDNLSIIETDDDGSVVGDIDIDVDEFDEPETEPIPIGGKRRRITKRKTNKKKTKKNNNRKTRKHRKRRYSGGADNFRMTTENNISPYNNQNDKDTAVILAQKLR